MGPGGFLTVIEPFGLEARQYKAVFGKRPQCASKNKREQGEHICLRLHVYMCVCMRETQTGTECNAGAVMLVPKNTNGHFIVKPTCNLPEHTNLSRAVKSSH